MSSTEIARRYARALLAITKQKSTHRQSMNELSVISGTIENDPTIKAYFENPLVTPDQKLQVVKKALASQKMSEDVYHLLQLLAERQRLGQLPGVVEAYQQGIDEEEGITRGVIRAAKPLTPEAQKSLEEKISTTLKKKIVLSFKEDPHILGGLIAEVGGWTFDDSLENHLKKLNEDLNRSAE